MSEQSPYNRVVQKLEREWEKTQEKAEAAKKGLEEELRKFFRENRQKLAKEALDNIRSAPGENPFKNLKGLEGGKFGGYADMTGYNKEDFIDEE